MNRIIENNQVTVIGEIVSEFSFSHEIFGEGFYMVDVRVKRLSESYDIIPVMVSARIFDVSSNYIGKLLYVNGQFRSYNRHEGARNRLILAVFATDISYIWEIDETYTTNQILLNGHICKEPSYRKTPLGREIADLLLAVNRPYGKSDYIPCICWGRTARYVGTLNVGEYCSIEGRIQSRQYVKKLDDGNSEERTAYEVSVSKLEVHEDEE